MTRDTQQVKLDCAILHQAVVDLRMWTVRCPAIKPSKTRCEAKADSAPLSEAFRAFSDAARWMFDGAEHGPWHFSLTAICCRLEIDVGKVREAVRAKLTQQQRAWIAALGIRDEGIRGHS